MRAFRGFRGLVVLAVTMPVGGFGGVIVTAFDKIPDAKAANGADGKSWQKSSSRHCKDEM